ncbi:MAG: hypothetical protein CSB06_01570 [Bacteroidia bacterium]|nr:MAG: hypothetical protein CSB06_01570 [Bacteroidia bacterium]
MTALIFAAGLGTRLFPLTKNKPKALVEVLGKPMLEHLLLKLKDAHFDHIVINVHHFASQIIDFLKVKNNFGLHIDISDERNLLLDTGGGILKAKPFLDKSDYFLVHNADIFTDMDLGKLIEDHQSGDALASLAVHPRKSSRQLIFDEHACLCGWENQQTNEKIISRKSLINNNYAFSGVHVISRKIFPLIEETGKFSIIDLYLRLAKDHAIAAHQANYNYWFDLGKYKDIQAAEDFLQK